MRYSYKLQNLWEHWLHVRFGLTNHLALIMCFTSYEKWVHIDYFTLRPTYLRWHWWKICGNHVKANTYIMVTSLFFGLSLLCNKSKKNKIQTIKFYTHLLPWERDWDDHTPICDEFFKTICAIFFIGYIQWLPRVMQHLLHTYEIDIFS